jgi:hypothetical protein
MFFESVSTGQFYMGEFLQRREVPKMGLEENVQNKDETFLWFQEREQTDGIG